MATTTKKSTSPAAEDLPVLHPVVVPPDAPNPQSLTVAAQQFFTISTAAEYELSGLTLGDIKTAQKFFHDLFDESIDDWNKGHKRQLARRNKYTKPLEELESRIKSAQSAYSLDLIRKQREIDERNRRIIREEAERQAQEQIENLLEFGTPDAIEDAVRIGERLADGTLEVSAPPPMVLQVPKSGTGSSGRLVQKVLVRDEDRLDRAYMIPNLELLNSLFLSFGPDHWAEFEKLVGIGSVELEDSIIMSQRSTVK